MLYPTRVVIIMWALFGTTCASDNTPIGTCENTDVALLPIAGSADAPFTECTTSATITDNICGTLETDFTDHNENNAWSTCASTSILGNTSSSNARVAAYEAMGAKLWNKNSTVTVNDFLEARVILSEDQGLLSRLVRRYDPRFTPPESASPDNRFCSENANALTSHPDYCVGPAKLLPIINSAMCQGSLGYEIEINTERVHAALQWFLAVSTIKESTSCITTAADCDSSFAYYTAGTARELPAGLAHEINAISPQAHHRVYDAYLALGCWRKEAIENGQPLATCQLDNALVYGVSQLVKDRFTKMKTATNDILAAHHAWLNIIVPLLDRETRERNATHANTLLTEIAKPSADVNEDAAIAAIDAVYVCP